MALALILEVRDGPSGPVLRVDTGTNPFCRWRVGVERGEVDGMDELLGVSYESPVQRRVGTGAFQTTFDLPLDASRIDRDHRLVQVVSYKSPDGRSPAWSPIRSVYGYGVAGRVGSAQLNGAPAMSGRWGNARSLSRPTLAPARSITFSATEQPLSGALFWGDLLSLVDELAPLGQQLFELAGDEQVEARGAKLVELLGPVVKSLIEQAAQPAAAPAPAASVAQPVAPAAAAVATAPAPSAAVGPSAPARPAGLAARHPGAAHSQSVRVATAMDFQARPALVGLITTPRPAVLKAITLLLEKAPEMFQTYMDNPIKLLTAIADANRQDHARQQVQPMLRSGDQDLLLNLMSRLGQAPQPGIAARPTTSAPLSVRGQGRARSMARAQGRPTQRKVDQRIDVALVPLAPLPGQATGRSYYAAGQPVTLHVRLGTAHEPPNRPIPQVVAHVKVTHATTGATLLERRVELAQVDLNQLVDVPLDAAATQLPTGVDLNVSVDVTWTGKEGAAWTTPSRAIQQLTLVGDHLVLGLGERTGTELRLSDPHRYRSFWHQIWEGGSATHRRWELNATTRYYYRLAGDAPANGRMDTRFKPVPDRSNESESKVEWGGFLKSGMELAVGELNKLLPEVGLAPWSDAELAALQSGAFAGLTGRQATTELHLRGRTEERGSAWVFPVLEPVTVELHRVTAVGPTGAVEATEAAPKPFLLPVAAVFMGMESKG